MGNYATSSARQLRPTKRREVYPDLEDVEVELARRSFRNFVDYARPGYRWNWHHALTADDLQQWVDGTEPNIIFVQPPRHGKSEQVSRLLPPFIFGKFPDAQVMSVTYGADLSQRMNRDVQRVMDSDGYGVVFPEVKLPQENSRTLSGRPLRNMDIFEIPGHEGSYRCAGIGGAITGMGFDFGIIDDFMKNEKEADSLVIRDNHWEWYVSTFLTRSSPTARKLITATRWNEDDLIGRVLKRAKETGERWKVVRLPALAEEGSTDFPIDPRDTRPLGTPLWADQFGLEMLLRFKATLGSYRWAALYQGRPAPMEGGIFKRADWRYYGVIPTWFQSLSISVDATFKETGNSYVVVQVWGLLEGHYYLLDQDRGHWGLTDTVRSILAMLGKWPGVTATLIEDAANGPAAVEKLRTSVPGVIPVPPEGGKVSRAMAAQPLQEAHSLLLPDPERLRVPWLRDFIDECSNFPNGANDDQVDSMTQYLIWSQRHGIPLIVGPAGSTSPSYWLGRA